MEEKRLKMLEKNLKKMNKNIMTKKQKQKKNQQMHKAKQMMQEQILPKQKRPNGTYKIEQIIQDIQIYLMQ